MKDNTVRVFAEDMEHVESADILVDLSTRAEPVIGLQFNGIDGDRLIVPMSLDFAEHVAKDLMAYALMYKAVAAAHK